MSATPPASDPRSDRELHDLLHTWEVPPRDDPALARNVWARIEAERGLGSTASWFHRLSLLLARPAMAAAAIALFAVLGALAAQWRVTSAHEARTSQLAAEYAQSIDPILMTHAGSHAGHAP